jgi:hypothetical protein
LQHAEGKKKRPAGKAACSGLKGAKGATMQDKKNAACRGREKKLAREAGLSGQGMQR